MGNVYPNKLNQDYSPKFGLYTYCYKINKIEGKETLL
ncbi:hypothetical protein BH23BAC3_BH23BAC3_04880 [soil metagenome]